MKYFVDVGNPLFNGGDPDKEQVADAFLIHQCEDGTLCVLVKAHDAINIQDKQSEAWITLRYGPNE